MTRLGPILLCILFIVINPAVFSAGLNAFLGSLKERFRSSEDHKEPREKLNWYRKVLKKREEFSDAVVLCEWQARLEDQLHLFQWATQTLENCYEMSQDVEYRAQKASVFLHQGKVDEAREILVTTRGQGVYFLELVRWAQYSMEVKQYDEALNYWDKALENYPSQDPYYAAWILSRIGDLFALQEKYEEAFSNFQKAVELYPDLSLEKTLLKLVEEKLGKRLPAGIRSK